MYRNQIKHFTTLHFTKSVNFICFQIKLSRNGSVSECFPISDVTEQHAIDDQQNQQDTQRQKTIAKYPYQQHPSG